MAKDLAPLERGQTYRQGSRVDPGAFTVAAGLGSAARRIGPGTAAVMSATAGQARIPDARNIRMDSRRCRSSKSRGNSSPLEVAGAGFIPVPDGRHPHRGTE